MYNSSSLIVLWFVFKDFCFSHLQVPDVLSVHKHEQPFERGKIIENCRFESLSRQKIVKAHSMGIRKLPHLESSFRYDQDRSNHLGHHFVLWHQQSISIIGFLSAFILREHQCFEPNWLLSCDLGTKVGYVEDEIVGRVLCYLYRGQVLLDLAAQAAVLGGHGRQEAAGHGEVIRSHEAGLGLLHRGGGGEDLTHGGRALRGPGAAANTVTWDLGSSDHYSDSGRGRAANLLTRAEEEAVVVEHLVGVVKPRVELARVRVAANALTWVLAQNVFLKLNHN